jgi:hypothetical protein
MYNKDEEVLESKFNPRINFCPNCGRKKNKGEEWQKEKLECLLSAVDRSGGVSYRFLDVDYAEFTVCPSCKERFKIIGPKQ